MLGSFLLLYLDSYLLPTNRHADRVVSLEKEARYRKRQTRHTYRLITTQTQLVTTESVFSNLTQGDSIWREQSALFGSTLYLIRGEPARGQRFSQGFLIERQGRYALPVFTVTTIILLLLGSRFRARSRRRLIYFLLMVVGVALWAAYLDLNWW